jgi:2-iminobutanoate/2-iminopropanoate deaminase
MPRREVLHIPGVVHGAPIPTGVKCGNMVYSSALFGMDPDNGKVPEDVRKQVKLVFRHLKTLVEVAGGTIDNIAHTAVLLTDNSHRPFVNEEWLSMFPDENDRPARHVTITSLAPGVHVQIEMVAVLDT